MDISIWHLHRKPRRFLRNPEENQGLVPFWQYVRRPMGTRMSNKVSDPAWLWHGRQVGTSASLHLCLSDHHRPPPPYQAKVTGAHGREKEKSQKKKVAWAGLDSIPDPTTKWLRRIQGGDETLFVFSWGSIIQGSTFPATRSPTPEENLRWTYCIEGGGRSNAGGQ